MPLICFYIFIEVNIRALARFPFRKNNRDKEPITITENIHTKTKRLHCSASSISVILPSYSGFSLTAFSGSSGFGIS